ncbi:MAG TPA: hypothetical protein PKM51_02730 [Chitinophagales bacterium]|nr:hypothetical protein [Chitinophagales bacterium]
MRVLVISLLLLAMAACKKEKASQGLALNNTNWELHFKNNPSFSFFAKSQLVFDGNKRVSNFRFSDTLVGTWNTEGNAVTLQFTNGDTYKGKAITADSLSGTLTASGNSGVWYAIKN